MRAGDGAARGAHDLDDDAFLLVFGQVFHQRFVGVLEGGIRIDPLGERAVVSYAAVASGGFFWFSFAAGKNMRKKGVVLKTIVFAGVAMIKTIFLSAFVGRRMASSQLGIILQDFVFIIGICFFTAD